MLIYRVEDRDGQGPYNYASYEPEGSILHRMRKHHRNLKGTTHPVPNLDGCRHPEPSDRCGFKNMHDLRTWFKGFLAGLVREGYQVVTYEVPHTRVSLGKHQLIFDSSFATNKTTLNHRHYNPDEQATYLHAA